MSHKVKLADGSVPRVVAMVLAMLLGAAAARASVLDQSVPSNNTLGLSPYEESQQQVTDGISGTLSGITLYSSNFQAPSETEIVGIAVGSGFYTGPFAFTTTAVLTEAGTFIDTSSANIQLTAGEHFVIDLKAAPTTADGLVGGSSTISYAGGDLYEYYNGIVGDVTTEGGPDNYPTLAFKTYVTPPAAAPEIDPASTASGVTLLIGSLFVLRGRRSGKLVAPFKSPSS